MSKTTDWASQAAREFSATIIGLSDFSEAKLAEIIRNHAHFATPAEDAGEDGELLIIDAAVEVAVFSKTHEWPKEMSPDFFKFAQLLDDLATKIQARYPEFNKNVRAAKSNSPSAGAAGGKS